MGAEAQSKLLNHHRHVEVHTNTPAHLSSRRHCIPAPGPLHVPGMLPPHLLPIQSSDLGSTVTSGRHTFLAQRLAHNLVLRNSLWNE